MATKNDTLHHPDHYTLVGGGDHRRLGVLDLLHGLREGGNMPRAICRFNTSYVLLLGPWSAPVKGLGRGYSLADAPNHSGQHAVVGGGDHRHLDAPQLPSLRGGGGAQVKSGLSLLNVCQAKGQLHGGLHPHLHLPLHEGGIPTL